MNKFNITTTTELYDSIVKVLGAESIDVIDPSLKLLFRFRHRIAFKKYIIKDIFKFFKNMNTYVGVVSTTSTCDDSGNTYTTLSMSPFIKHGGSRILTCKEFLWSLNKDDTNINTFASHSPHMFKNIYNESMNGKLPPYIPEFKIFRTKRIIDSLDGSLTLIIEYTTKIT